MGGECKVSGWMKGWKAEDGRVGMWVDGGTGMVGKVSE